MSLSGASKTDHRMDVYVRVCVIVVMHGWQRGRGTERQRDREAERQRDRETGRQGDRETGRQRDRETERQGDRETEKWRDRETEGQKFPIIIIICISLGPQTRFHPVPKG